MKNLVRYLPVVMLMALGSVSFPAPAAADDTLLDGMMFSKRYLVQLSGTVMNETFAGAQVLLILMPPSLGGINPYQLTIEGFPKNNSRNSFFWNSEFSQMTAVANEITCDIKQTFVKPVPMHFFFLSPELLRHTGEAFEGEKFVEQVALPTRIEARAGKLKLRIQADSVSGTVWMKGYDPIEKAFVLYSARLYGKSSIKLEHKQEVKK